jgi:serine/threonine-protein kinase
LGHFSRYIFFSQGGHGMAETGQRVGDYEVLSLLGSGGMGRVYRVRSVITNREEAMKILLPDFASEPELAARFMAEIRTLAGLDHPNITQLRTAFQIQNQFVMVMEYVEGTTLDKVSSKLPVEQVIEYSMQVLSALSYAHSRGVTHRDIKPANIMITSHGVVKLMDFGIAKSTTDLNLTRPGTTMGSIYYMSPEQVRGGSVDGRTDIYSFGVTMYEMLTGRKPFEAETSFSVLNAQLNEAPAPPAQWNPALPPALNDIVLIAMAKDPNVRFQTAEEFRNALKGLREHAAAQPPLAAAAAAAVIPMAAASQTAPPVTQSGQPSGYQQSAVNLPPPPAGQPSQGFTPVAVGAAPAPASGKSHRSLWIGLGALAAVLAVVAAATVLPHFLATHADQKNAAQTASNATSANPPLTPAVDNSQPAAPPSTPEAAPTPAPSATPASATPASATSASPSPAAAPPPAHSAPSPSQHTAPPAQDVPVATPAPPAQAVPAGPSPEEVRRARDRFMDLDARAQTVTSGVEQLRRQQQAQGYDIRGDIASSENRMNNDLREADRALNDHDLEAGRDYMDKAGEELRRLEGFLGR